MTKKALITGITGQDGSYLAEFLLEKGYEVHGFRRRSSSHNTSRIDHLIEKSANSDVKMHLHYGDLTDSTSITRVIARVQPDEIYNLAAQSHVHVSFDSPEYTANADGIGTLRMLEALRTLGLESHTKFYQASTSELYGLIQEPIQSESTPFYPRSPYAVAKLYAYWITVNYREAYKMFACNGILFNHESERRGATFVTRKITKGLAKIITGKQDCLHMGNLDAERDWGHAKDYVEMQWLMLQQEQPEDYVIATGAKHSVREFIEISANLLGLVIEWKNCGLEEVGVVVDFSLSEIHVLNDGMKKKLLNKEIIAIDPYYFRPTEVEVLLGDASKAKEKLNWVPKITFEDMVKEMIRADLESEK